MAKIKEPTAGHTTASPKLLATARLIRDLDSNAKKTKLQKVLYRVQGWSLACLGSPLFPETPRAYKNGPVYPSILADDTYYKGSAVAHADTSVLTPDEVLLITSQVSEYLGTTAKQMSDATHEENAWIEARGDLSADASGTESIGHDAMLRDILLTPPSKAPTLAGAQLGPQCMPASDFFETEKARWAVALDLLSA